MKFSTFVIFAILALFLVVAEASPRLSRRDDDEGDEFGPVEVREYGLLNLACSGDYTTSEVKYDECRNPRSMVTRRSEKVRINSSNNVTVFVYDGPACKDDKLYKEMEVIKGKCFFDHGILSYAIWNW